MTDWILDMDGVLVDSEEFMALAAKAALEEYAASLVAGDNATDTTVIDVAAFQAFSGMGEIKYISGVAGKYGIPIVMERGAATAPIRDIFDLKELAYDYYDRLVEGEHITLPGVPDFMYRVQETGGKIAIATGADRRKMVTNVRIMGYDIDSLDACVTGDDPEVTKGKPDPQIFLLAAARMRSTVENCIVAEDSVNGIRAAIRGGFRCVGITTAYSQAELQSQLGKEAPQWYAPNLASLPKNLQP